MLHYLALTRTKRFVLMTLCMCGEINKYLPQKNGSNPRQQSAPSDTFSAARMALQPFDLDPTSTRSAKPGSMAPFGSKVPLAEPSWYQNLNTPYYNASHVAWRAKLRDFFEKEVEPSE